MSETAVTVAPPRREWMSDGWRIGFILLMSLLTRSWTVTHTEVLSRDSITFIRYALQIEEPPTSALNSDRKMTRAEVLKASFHPPGYAVSIIAVSWPVRAILGGTTCDSMALSAQIASLLASLLLVVPMYFLGKLAFHRQTAFLATLFFQVLPVSAQIASDGLSDNLFLFLCMSATWFGAIGFRRHSSIWFGLAGFGGGLTYLVRPEGLVCVATIGLVLVAFKIRGEFRWREFLLRVGLLSAGLVVVMGPYVATIERLTNKPTGEQLFRWLGGEEIKPGWIRTAEEPNRTQNVNFPLAKWYTEFGNGKTPDLGWASKAVGGELLKTSFYVMPFFAALGMAFCWPHFRGNGPVALIVVLGFCHSTLLLIMAMKAGYVAERHTLLIALCSSYFAAAAIPILGEKLARLPGLRAIASARCCSAALAIVFVGTCLPAGMKSLHGNRAGHHAAGLWIAANQQTDDFVLDPFAWGEYYSGRIRLPSDPVSSPHTAYILQETNANMHPRLHAMHVAHYFADRSAIVYHWPENVPVEQGKVFVYRWQGDNFDQIWREAHDHFARVAAGAK